MISVDNGRGGWRTGDGCLYRTSISDNRAIAKWFKEIFLSYKG
jgi:hypothetical protein